MYADISAQMGLVVKNVVLGCQESLNHSGLETPRLEDKWDDIRKSA